jgi:hypothetical protein
MRHGGLALIGGSDSLVKIIAVAAISCEACQLRAPAPLRAMKSLFCAARLLGMDRRTGAGVPRFSSIIMRGKPSTMPPHTRGVNCMYTPRQIA